jgi:pimeloyl-ACP methyl ester carboxylesterase
MSSPAPYAVRRPSRSSFVTVRGLRHHVREWGDRSLATPQRPTAVLLHGWMDVGASYQFMVDELSGERHLVAFDWRGFGLSEHLGSDTYWFGDYIGDLDGVLDALGLDQPVDLVGHSMGGNIATVYAGLRPQRLRSLANLEGWGMPATKPQQAPDRFVKWLDELKRPPQLKDYASLDEVAQRMRRNNPRLTPERAHWVAAHWASEREGGRWALNADPAHKGSTPTLYRVEEILAIWDRITAPVLWAEGSINELALYWGAQYTREEFDARLAHIAHVRKVVIADAGHMVHHDQPRQLAQALEAFWAQPAARPGA